MVAASADVAAEPVGRLMNDGEHEEIYSDDFAGAVHEAGHVCIGLCQGFRVKAVDLVQDGSRLGITRFDGEVGDWEERFRYILAGTIAEEMLGEGDPETLAMHRGGDMHMIGDLLREAGEDPESWSPRVVSLADETRAMVKSNWAMIEKLARRLLRKGCLSEEEIGETMSGIYEEDSNEDWRREVA